MAITQRRKLLTAAVGVATVSYVMACGGEAGGGGAETSGNLVAAGGYDGRNDRGGAGSRASAGSGGTSAQPAGYAGGATSGNLVSVPPIYYPPPEPLVDGGAADAPAPATELGADAAAGEQDAALDSGP